MEEKELVDLFFERNEKAISRLEEKFGNYCFTIAKNILMNFEDSQECVQDVYYKVWNSIPPKRPDNFKAWLGKTVRNSALNILAKNHAKKRSRQAETSFEELQDCLSSEYTSETALDSSELGEIISAWLRTLESEDRILFVRRYWFGERLTDLAKKKNIPEKKLAMKMYELRKELKTALEKEGVAI